MIYKGMDKEERNRIIEERCQAYGIPVSYDGNGNAGYVPDIEDRIQFYENCEDPVIREIRSNALTAAMGDPEGDDSWIDLF